MVDAMLLAIGETFLMSIQLLARLSYVLQCIPARMGMPSGRGGFIDKGSLGRIKKHSDHTHIRYRPSMAIRDDFGMDRPVLPRPCPAIPPKGRLHMDTTWSPCLLGRLMCFAPFGTARLFP